MDIESFAGESWRKILRAKGKPGWLVRRHLEVGVFSYLAAELRSGDIAVVGSDSHANLHAQLMSWTECEPLVAQFGGQAGIPTEAGELVAFYRQKLTATTTAMDAGYPSNTDLVLDAIGADAGLGEIDGEPFGPQILRHLLATMLREQG